MGLESTSLFFHSAGSFEYAFKTNMDNYGLFYFMDFFIRMEKLELFGTDFMPKKDKE